MAIFRSLLRHIIRKLNWSRPPIGTVIWHPKQQFNPLCHSTHPGKGPSKVTNIRNSRDSCNLLRFSFKMFHLQIRVETIDISNVLALPGLVPWGWILPGNAEHRKLPVSPEAPRTTTHTLPTSDVPVPSISQIQPTFDLG